MRYFIVVAAVCFLASNFVFAQQGTQRLRLAQSIYDQGRLHELPGVLADSALSNFTKEDKVSAYKLLTLAYLYLEEPEKADASMLKLLQTDHFFEPNEAVDPAEFLGLYKTFRTKPVYGIGLKFGVNSTIPLLSSLYYVSDGGQGSGKYTAPLSIQVGIVFEKALFSNSKKKTLRRLIFSPELLYDTRTLGYTNNNFFYDNVKAQTHAKFIGTIKQTWLSFNPMVQLKMNKSKTLQTYLALGPGFSYILSGSVTAPAFTWNSGAGSTNGSNIDNTKSYLKIAPSVIAAAGLKFKFGSIYLTAEGRVQYGFVSPVNSSTRTNKVSVFDYSYTLSDYKPLTLMANLGFVFPYFNPIKLKRK